MVGADHELMGSLAMTASTGSTMTASSGSTRAIADGLQWPRFKQAAKRKPSSWTGPVQAAMDFPRRGVGPAQGVRVGPRGTVLTSSSAGSWLSRWVMLTASTTLLADSLSGRNGRASQQALLVAGSVTRMDANVAAAERLSSPGGCQASIRVTSSLIKRTQD
jgi:hypothetical protein